MSTDGGGSKELLEQNHQTSEMKKRVKEDELRGGGPGGTHNGPQVPQKTPQGSLVCWERFLHLRSLKVLLVENDNSTRHVLSALLQNCSYEVIEAANGLQAWKILEDLMNHVDLILTEVVMPCLSGIGLLCKIMSHKSRKNVPVIMMSSHDSMGLVFKCLSKGAVDFLVKPIRKNELKNLWQHVWRRCHSSSGSGSESGSQTQKSIKSKSVEDSDNNAISNDEEENESAGLNVGDGSDNGSGTQSSWTKQAVEAESPRHASSWNQVAKCPDSICALIVHPNSEMCDNLLASAVPLRKECQEHKEKNDYDGMGKDLEIGIPGELKLQLDYPSDVKTILSVARQNNQVEKSWVDFDHKKPSTELKRESQTVTCAVTIMTDLQIDNSANFHARNGCSKVSDIKSKGTNDTYEIASLELSLKRLRGSKCDGSTVKDERNVLRRSDFSAFSRYNSASNDNKTLTANSGNSLPRDNSAEVIKHESPNSRSHSSDNPPNQNTIQAGNNLGTGYREQVMEYTDGQKEHQTQHLHIHYDNYEVHHHHHHHHLVHDVQDQHPPMSQNEFTLKKLGTSAPHCGSSNALSGPGDGRTGNSSTINRSTSGSNHGSSAAVNVGGTNIESDNGVCGRSGSSNAGGSGREIDTKSTHREAALTKFRLKRKERCFRKKVRYQSRKKLAEQRPRVRGQFVRRTVDESTSRASDS